MIRKVWVTDRPRFDGFVTCASPWTMPGWVPHDSKFPSDTVQYRASDQCEKILLKIMGSSTTTLAYLILKIIDFRDQIRECGRGMTIGWRMTVGWRMTIGWVWMTIGWREEGMTIGWRMIIGWPLDDHWMTIGWPSYQSPVQRPGQWHIGNFLYCLKFFNKLCIIKKVTRKRCLSSGCTNVRDLVLQAIISIVLFLCSFAIFGEAHVF